MSAPKKPGKDLSALKARLAKKSAKPSAPSDVPAPGEQIAEPAPAPEAEQPAPAADVPAPGEVAQPAAAAPADIPAPGEVSRPAPEPQPAAPAPAQAADPFGGGAAFNPDAGLIDDVGEVAPRKQTGLIALVAVVGLGLGIGMGWILHQGSDTRARVSAASKKGGEMLEEVNKISETRKKISLKWEDFKSTATKDPAAATEMLTGILTEDLKEFPNANALFGWQLAAMDPAAIKRIFSLYEEANGLFIDLGYLANYMQQNKEALSEAGGPSQFAVIGRPEGMVMVELTKAICNIEEKTQCEKGTEAEAVGYAVREEIGGPEAIVSKEEAFPLLPAGKIFAYAFTETPGKNALISYAKLVAKVEQRMEKMAKLEKQAIEALESFEKDPNVDGSGGGGEAAAE